MVGRGAFKALYILMANRIIVMSGPYTVMPATTHRIRVKLPRDKFDCVATSASADLVSRMPTTFKDLTILELRLHSDAKVTVEGYGVPFANQYHPCGKWLNENTPMVEGLSLLDVLEQRTFRILVALSVDVAKRHVDYTRLPLPCENAPGHGMDLDESDHSSHGNGDVDFHHDLFRGVGFHKSLCENDPATKEQVTDNTTPHLSRASLPIVNLLGIPEDLLGALMEEVLPQDRARYRKYLSDRPLGFGIITGVSTAVSSLALSLDMLTFF